MVIPAVRMHAPCGDKGGLTLVETIAVGRTQRIASIGVLDALKREGQFREAFTVRSNQLLVSGPAGASFREANKQDDGRYHVFADKITGEKYRVALPPKLCGPDGKEFNVAEARDIALSLVLDLMPDGRPTFETSFDKTKKEHLIQVNDPALWFFFTMPQEDGEARMVFDANGVLKGLHIFRLNGCLGWLAFFDTPNKWVEVALDANGVQEGFEVGDVIYFRRTYSRSGRGEGENWLGLVELDYFLIFRAHNNYKRDFRAVGCSSKRYGVLTLAPEEEAHQKMTTHGCERSFKKNQGVSKGDGTGD